MSFTGKFVYYYGDDGCQKGEIVDHIGDLVLIRWDRMRGDFDPHDPAMVCVAVSEMVMNVEKDEYPKWEFFMTRAELDAFNSMQHDHDDDSPDDKPPLTVVN